MSPLRFDRAALRRIRLERGLSQRALAARMNIGRERIGLYEVGRCQPTLSSVSRMADALGVDWTDLVTRGKRAPRKAVAA